MLSQILKSTVPDFLEPNQRKEVMDKIKKKEIEETCEVLANLLTEYDTNPSQLRDWYAGSIDDRTDMAIDMAQDFCGGHWDEDVAQRMLIMTQTYGVIKLQDLNALICLFSEIEKSLTV